MDVPDEEHPQPDGDEFKAVDRIMKERIMVEESKVRTGIISKEKIERKRPRMVYKSGLSYGMQLSTNRKSVTYSRDIINSNFRKMRLGEKLFVYESHTDITDCKIKYRYIQQYLAVLHCNISSNHLESLPVVNLFLNLTTLIATDSNLKDVSNLKGLGNLREIDFSRNEIEIIPETLCNLPSLQTLNLTVNKIRVIPSFISNLTQLEVLNLRYNKLTDDSNIKHLGGLLKLINLRLSYNLFTIVPRELGELTNLKDLCLANWNLRRIHSNVFGLQLTKTCISVIDTGSIKYCRGVEQLRTCNLYKPLYDYYMGKGKYGVRTDTKELHNKLINHETVYTLLLCYKHGKADHSFLYYAGKGIVLKICEQILKL